MEALQCTFSMAHHFLNKELEGRIPNFISEEALPAYLYNFLKAMNARVSVPYLYILSTIRICENKQFSSRMMQVVSWKARERVCV